MLGEDNSSSQPFQLVSQKRRQDVVNWIVQKLVTWYGSEPEVLKEIKNLVLREESKAFQLSHSQADYLTVLSQFVEQAENAHANTSLSSQSTNETHQKEVFTQKDSVLRRNGQSEIFNRIRAQTAGQENRMGWKATLGSLLLSPLHYDHVADTSAVTGMTFSASSCGVKRVQEDDKNFGRKEHSIRQVQSNDLPRSTKGTKRVASVISTSDNDLTIEDVFTSLKSKYKVPIRILNGMLPLIQNDKSICPPELVQEIHKIAKLLELDRKEILKLPMKHEEVAKIEAFLQRILHMFRPLMKEVIQWVETFGRSWLQVDSNQLCPEKNSSNTETNLAKARASFTQLSDSWSKAVSKGSSEQITSPKPTMTSLENSHVEHTISSQSSQRGGLTAKDQRTLEETHVSGDRSSVLLLNAVEKTMGSIEAFEIQLNRMKDSKGKRAKDHLETLKHLKDRNETLWRQGEKEDDYNSYDDDVQYLCSFFQKKYPHLLLQVHREAAMYISCQVICNMFRFPILYIFPCVEQDKDINFVVQSSVCGYSEWHEHLKHDLQLWLNSIPSPVRTISDIIEGWATITELFLKTATNFLEHLFCN